MKKALYFSLGIVCLVLGSAGIILPILPTTPFLLLAAFFFSKSSERWNQWLLNHKIFGPFIKNFRDHRGIHVKHKRFAYAMMWATLLASIYLVDVQWVRFSLVGLGLSLTLLIASFRTLR